MPSCLIPKVSIIIHVSGYIVGAKMCLNVLTLINTPYIQLFPIMGEMRKVVAIC